MWISCFTLLQGAIYPVVGGGGVNILKNNAFLNISVEHLGGTKVIASFSSALIVVEIGLIEGNRFNSRYLQVLEMAPGQLGNKHLLNKN